MMKQYIKVLVMLMFLSFSNIVNAQNHRLKPSWLKNTPESYDSNVTFIPVTVYSTDSQALPAKALGALADRLPSDWNVKRTVIADEEDFFVQSVGQFDGKTVQTGKINVSAEGESSLVKCLVVDDYQVVEDGVIKYDVLYQVARSEAVQFLETYTTRKYGTEATLMSLIPGLGQFYKGDPLKGGLFLGGCTAGAVGIIVTESQRQAYISQMSQTHDANIIRQLDARQKNMSVARNVCIGIAAGLYIWNLIDGAVAPGASRVVLTGNSIIYNF